MSRDVQKEIQETVTTNKVVVYMKGTPSFPQCGFSATVVQILDSYGVPYTGVNVLADGEVREGVKQFSQWPTVPQIYIDGEFIGGCDIAREMHANGELAALLKPAN